MNATFGWSNLMPLSSLLVGSAVAGLGAEQIGNDQGSPASAWQTAGALTPTAGAWLQADAVVPRPWRQFAVCRTNWTSAATLRIMLGSSAGSKDVLDLTVTGLASGYGQLIKVLPAPLTARHCRLEISDPTNPDGFLNTPLLYAGPCWEPTINIDWSSAPGSDAEIDAVTTRGGGEFATLRWERRRWDVSCQGILADEVWPQVMELQRFARRGGNVLFVPNGAGAQVQREAVFGRLQSQSDVTYPFQSAERRAWRARITERL